MPRVGTTVAVGPTEAVVPHEGSAVAAADGQRLAGQPVACSRPRHGYDDAVTEWRDGFLPDEVINRLSGDDLAAAIGFTVLLLTATAEGWPHMAMLSLGEVVVVDPGTIRLGLWPNSTAANNLARREKGTLNFVADERSYSIRVDARLLGILDIEQAGTRACFDGTVDAVGIDTAPYAVLESGVRYRLNDPASTLSIWERTREALARSPGPRA